MSKDTRELGYFPISKEPRPVIIDPVPFVSRLAWCRYCLMVLSALLVCLPNSKWVNAWDWGEEVQVETGFLFVNGQYVAPPYYLRWDPEPTLNGFPIGSSITALLAHDAFDESQWNPWDDPWTEAQRDLIDVLFLGRVVVADDDQPLVLLEREDVVHNLLKFWTSNRVDELHLVSVLSQLPPYAHQEGWRTWLTNFRPPSELLQRAIAAVHQTESIVATNTSQVAAVRRLSMLEYPLSLAGMIVGVLTLGHLIRYRPILDQQASDPSIQLAAIQATAMCLLLVMANGGLDLTWSILTYQAGSMREVNPIGGHFLANPENAINFKLGMTTFSCGLLFMLRRSKFAQFATWWICLACVLLTFRWLLFQSLMVPVA